MHDIHIDAMLSFLRWSFLLLLLCFVTRSRGEAQEFLLDDTPLLQRLSTLPRPLNDTTKAHFLVQETQYRQERQQDFHMRPEATTPQIVFLDFDSETDGGEYVFTTEDRASITARLEDEYGSFNVQFVMTQPVMGSTSTIVFNSNSFGAENIDFLNQVATDNAYVNIALTGVTGSENIVRLAGNLAAHYLGHLLGARHFDSFGPLGGGLPSRGIPSPQDYDPEYDGPQNADETDLHIMDVHATPAMYAMNRFFLGERSTIKLSFACGRGNIISESTAKTQSAQGAGIELPDLFLDNTIQRGVNSGTAFLCLRGLVIDQAVLSNQNEIDEYRLQLTAGEILTAEVVSIIDENTQNPFDSRLTLVKEAGNNLFTESTNDDDFETADAVLLDVAIPETATYRLQVSSNPNIALSPGSYKLLIYSHGPGPVAASKCPTNPTPAPPTPTPPTPTPSDLTCFSSENLVEVQDRGIVSMDLVQVGDFVRVRGNNRFSQIYSFGHRDPDLAVDFIQFKLQSNGILLGTNSKYVEMSPEHMVFVHKEDSEIRAVAASAIKEGDMFVAANGTPQKVVAIAVVKRKGIFAPFTFSGEIVVNGILASTYAAISNDSTSIMNFQWMAHAALSPLRLLCGIHFDWCKNETYDDRGISRMLLIYDWTLKQHKVVQVVICLFLAPFVLLSHLLLENLSFHWILLMLLVPGLVYSSTRRFAIFRVLKRRPKVVSQILG